MIRPKTGISLQIAKATRSLALKEFIIDITFIYAEYSNFAMLSFQEGFSYKYLAYIVNEYNDNLAF